jgi:putative membrane protein
MKAFFSSLAVVTFAGAWIFTELEAEESTAFLRSLEAGRAFKIQASRLVNERAQSTDVKSFALQIISDHEQIQEEIGVAVRAANASTPKLKGADARQEASLLELNGLVGDEFDQAYLRAQLQTYLELVALVRSYAHKGRTDSLKDFARKELPTFERHLRMVQELSKPGKTSGN